MTPAVDPPRDLPDRIIRESLLHPDNLRALLREAVPDLAASFDCTRAQLLDREFPLDDWRRREADVPMEIPFRTEETEVWALVLLLLEHQSSADPMMPLRLLYFAVNYWDRQWRAWEQQTPPRPPFRLRPVLPLVVYTGLGPWNTHRTIADMLGEPSVLHTCAPAWQPLFWNLADKSADELLASGEAWLQTLAVLRAEGADAATFEKVFREAQARLEAIHGPDLVRWYNLMRIVLTWAYWRRPQAERASLTAAAEAGAANIERRKEVQTMELTIAEALIQEGVAKGKAEGEAKGKAEGELWAFRKMLRRLLTQRFGPLPDKVLTQIDGAADLERLENATLHVAQLGNLDDLVL